MRPSGSRDGAIRAGEAPLSLSQSQSLSDACEPSGRRRRVEGTAPRHMKTDRRSPPAAAGANMSAAAETRVVRSERHSNHDHNSGP